MDIELISKPHAGNVGLHLVSYLSHQAMKRGK